MKDRATQMGIEHVTDILDKPTDRGYIAHAHTTGLENTYQRWPKEAHEANQAKLPTLCVLSYIRNIPEAELESIPNIQTINHIANNIQKTHESGRQNNSQPAPAHPEKPTPE
jgi:hypothetical protein